MLHTPVLCIAPFTAIPYRRGTGGVQPHSIQGAAVQHLQSRLLQDSSYFALLVKNASFAGRGHMHDSACSVVQSRRRHFDTLKLSGPILHLS